MTPISKHEENDIVPELQSSAHFNLEFKFERSGEATTANEQISQNIKLGQKPLRNLTYSKVTVADSRPNR